MTALVLRVLLVGLVAYRLARAVALDSISDPFRDWLHARAYRIYPPPPGQKEPVARLKSRPWSWAYSLASCPFCCSFWLALGAFALWAGEWSMDCAVGMIASAGLASVFVVYDTSKK